MLKEFWFDVETTGRDASKNEITQIAGELCGEQFNYYCRPTNWEAIEPEALIVQGKTLEDLRSYPEPGIAFASLIELLHRHIDRFNKLDKADMFAYNASFDVDFLFAFFRRYSPPDGIYRKHNVGNYFIKSPICVMQAYRLAVKLGKFPMPENFRLGTLCEAHGIELKAHDALSDILATKALFKKVLDGYDIH